MKEKYKKLYSEIALVLTEFSSADRANVGALLLKDGRIISTGYNGQPSGKPHKVLMHNGHDISTIHAEMNCLMFASKIGIKTKDCEIFCSHFPCVDCTKHLYQAGIKKIYYVNDHRNSDNIYSDLIKTEKVILND